MAKKYRFEYIGDDKDDNVHVMYECAAPDDLPSSLVRVQHFFQGNRVWYFRNGVSWAEN